jgi:hypothetical protein
VVKPNQAFYRVFEALYRRGVTVHPSPRRYKVMAAIRGRLLKKHLGNGWNKKWMGGRFLGLKRRDCRVGEACRGPGLGRTTVWR